MPQAPCDRLPTRSLSSPCLLLKSLLALAWTWCKRPGAFSLLWRATKRHATKRDTLQKVALSHPENIHRLLGEEDERVLYVKLADRMHNLRTIQVKSPESQRSTAEETLLFFVPLAKYLGLSEAAEELKNRSFGMLGR